MKPEFKPGNNIAMKVPTHEFDQTVHFYGDVLGLERDQTAEQTAPGACCFKFGDKTLWIDSVATISQAEIWLEIIADDIEAAAQYLQQHNCVRRDEIEPLPDGFKGFWVSNPANIIHLVSD